MSVAENSKSKTGSSTGGVYDESKKAYNILTSRGIPPIQAIGIIGNLYGESNLNPNAKNKSGAVGVNQWLGPRKDKLYAEYGDNPSFEDQLDYLVNEHQGKYPGLGWNFSDKGRNVNGYYQHSRDEFNKARSIEDATIAWNQGFGRPGKGELRNSDRINYAKSFASYMDIPLSGTAKVYEKAKGLNDKSTGVLSLFDKYGIDVEVTSGLREGAKTKQGRVSHHATGSAFDIKPSGGETWETITDKIKKNPEIVRYFKDNNLGILDETSASMLAKTGGTGKHFHIGPDRMAVSNFDKIIEGIDYSKVDSSSFYQVDGNKESTRNDDPNNEPLASNTNTNPDQLTELQNTIESQQSIIDTQNELLLKTKEQETLNRMKQAREERTNQFNFLKDFISQVGPTYVERVQSKG